MMRYMFHYARSIRERKAIIDWFISGAYHDPEVFDKVTMAYKTGVSPTVAAFRQSPDPSRPGRCDLRFSDWINVMCDYIPVGFANTLGYAHPNSGDTMTSVMIGGLRTVMNGDFEVYTGDPIQW